MQIGRAAGAAFAIRASYSKGVVRMMQGKKVRGGDTSSRPPLAPFSAPPMAACAGAQPGHFCKRPFTSTLLDCNRGRKAAFAEEVGRTAARWQTRGLVSGPAGGRRSDLSQRAASGLISDDFAEDITKAERDQDGR